MSNEKYYAKYRSTHAHHARHAKPTRWARAVARVESVKLWAEIAFAPLNVVGAFS
jgi:hypothetical protein